VREQAGRIRVTVVEGGCEVELAGEIDASLRDQASESMVDVLASQGTVVVDASQVTFIDSTGLAFLFQLKQVTQAEDRELHLRNPARVVTDLIEVAGMSDVLPIQRD
jgi:anti-sigma B factor antagonist